MGPFFFLLSFFRFPFLGWGVGRRCAFLFIILSLFLGFTKKGDVFFPPKRGSLPKRTLSSEKESRIASVVVMLTE